MWFQVIVTDNEGTHRLIAVQAKDGLEAGKKAQEIYEKEKPKEEKGGE